MAEPVAARAPDDIARELREAIAPRYELLDRLGTGGMGAVFRAREPALKRLVAIKVLAPDLAADDVARARFEREGRAAAALSHPNVIAVHGVGETGARRLPYLVMQYVDGVTLSDWLATNGPAPERVARRMLGDVASALAAAHARGLVHRDIKPSNVLLEAASGRAFVADFGVSGFTEGTSQEGAAPARDAARITTTGLIIGTPMYMSPEQCAGEVVSDRSDVYALGVVAFELLTGELPFQATSPLSWAAAHLRDPAPRLASRRDDLSPELAELIDRCLAKDPAVRPSAPELAAGLVPTFESEVQWPPPGLGPLGGRALRVSRAALLAGGAALALAVGLALPPAAVRAAPVWWERYADVQNVAGSTLGVVRESGSGGPSVVVRLWELALPALLVLLGIACTVLLARLLRLVRALPRARALGWEWATLADVVADPDGRSGLLLAGARDVAAIPPERRRAILAARRAQALVALATGAWALAVPAAWGVWALLGVLQPVGGVPLGRGALLLGALPAAVGMALTLAAAAREAQLLRPLARRRPHVSAVPASGTTATMGDVTAWYEVVRRAHTVGTRRADHALAVSLPAVALLALLLAAGLAGLTTAAAATLLAGRHLQRTGPATARLAAELGALSTRDPVADARRAWADYLPSRAVGADETSAVARALATTSGATTSGATAADTRAADTRAADARTALLRRLAHAAPADLWPLTRPRPIDAYPTLGEMPEPPYGAVRAAAQANAAAARGIAPDSARVRYGENAALAEHLLRTPRRFAAEFGVGLLQDMALHPLAALEERAGRAPEAMRLREAAAAAREYVTDRMWQLGPAGLAASPDGLSMLTALLREPRVLPGMRADAFAAALAGYCLNAREVLAGPSPWRAAALEAAARAMTDLPDALPLARVTVRTWEASHDGSVDELLTRLRFCRTVWR